MVPYEEALPGTDVVFEMVPVPGGVATIDIAPAGEPPQLCEVELPPYWIGRHEVTWGEYRRYMELDSEYTRMAQLNTLRAIRPDEVDQALAGAAALRGMLDKRTAEVDAVTAPTPLYDPSTTYESGEDPDLPAVTMTPFAARQYTKWLSAITGREYRLPSEAEWRHAALAGDDPEALLDGATIDRVSWHTDNSDWIAQPVGKKEPNAWGLHDTLGNVAELVLDAHPPEGRPGLAGKRVGWREGVAWPQKKSARLALGGWWDSERDEIGHDNRLPTDEEEWKASDPNLPRSPWWYADYPSTGVGFRLLRPLQTMPEEIRQIVWETQDDSVASAVEERLREGRGKRGPIGADLPRAIEQLESKPVERLLK